MKDLDLLRLVAKLSDRKDPFFIHGKRVARLSCAIAKTMKYPGEEIEIIHNAAVVHDIGKLVLPAEIINKPKALNKDEIVIIRKHPELGHSLLMQFMESRSVIAKVALQHHERLNGSGYPFGLRKDHIIPITRIVSVADVIETMVSPQPYRRALTMSEALREIRQNSGLLYDAEVVAAALTVIEGKGFSFSR